MAAKRPPPLHLELACAAQNRRNPGISSSDPAPSFLCAVEGSKPSLASHEDTVGIGLCCPMVSAEHCPLPRSHGGSWHGCSLSKIFPPRGQLQPVHSLFPSHLLTCSCERSWALPGSGSPWGARNAAVPSLEVGSPSSSIPGERRGLIKGQVTGKSCGSALHPEQGWRIPPCWPHPAPWPSPIDRSVHMMEQASPCLLECGKQGEW